MSHIYEALAKSGEKAGDLILPVANGKKPTPCSASRTQAHGSSSLRDTGPEGERSYVAAMAPVAAESVSRLKSVPVHQVNVERFSRLAFQSGPHGPAADRFRFLRMRLRELWKTKNLRRLLITSPLPQDGKSTVALNLATALCERGTRSVLVIEGDLYRSTIERELDLTGAPGMAECLKQHGLNPMSLVCRLDPLGWYFLPAGDCDGNATELLQSDRLAGVIQALAPHFDWVLIDSPPVAPLTDALSLAKQADASLLVVRAERTPREAVESAIGLLGKDHVLAILLNAVRAVERMYSKYYGDYRTP